MDTVVPKERLVPVVFLLLRSFLRPLLGVAVAWLLISCTQGEAPWLNAFLGARVWSPIAGLSYSMYLMEDVGQQFSSWPFLASTANLSKAIPVQVMRAYGAIVLYISAAMLLAVFNYTLVERPGVLLGKRVLSALKGLSTPADSKTCESKDNDLETAASTAVVPSIPSAASPTLPAGSASPRSLTSTRTPESRSEFGESAWQSKSQRPEQDSKTERIEERFLEV